jgi:type IV pilus assembly protein PilV
MNALQTAFRRSSAAHPALRGGGFTLVEVLIAVVILAIGLLGLAGLQTSAMKFNHSAYLRTQATNLAYDMADRMRANRPVALDGDYEITLATTPSGSPTTLAGQDLLEWKNTLAATLPSGNGAVDQVGTTTRFIITVQWDDSRGQDPVQQFIVTTEL